MFILESFFLEVVLYIIKNTIEDKSVRRRGLTQRYAELLIPVSTLSVQFQGRDGESV